MSVNAQSGADLATLTEAMLTQVGTVRCNDLSGLAKLHELCESLVRDTAPTGVDDTTRGLAKGICTGLEQIILDECENAEQTLVNLRSQVDSLATLLGFPGGVSATPVEDGPTLDADGLAGAFDEGDDGENLSAATSPADPASSAPPPVEQAEADAEAPAAGGAAVAPFVSEPLVLDPNEAEFVQSFVDEAGEHISAIEAALLSVEQNPEDATGIDALFRPFHTIKGMSGFLNLRDINSLTHETETLLDQVRKGHRPMTAGVIDLVFSVVDVVKKQVAEIAHFVAEPNENPVPQPPIEALVELLRRVVSRQCEPEGDAVDAARPGQKLGECLVERGQTTPEAVRNAVNRQFDEQPPRRTGEALVEMGAASARDVSHGLRAQQQAATPDASSRPASADRSIRIETEKLDALIDMVGELVIAQTMVTANQHVLGDPALTKDVSQVDKIVRDVQEAAMNLRMLPIGGTFQKMARLVRDVARKGGKKVELSISGEETELDKNVIQVISDPLVHMVRNAVDHGIEPPEDRLRAGKPETGRVQLSAYHHAGNIVIEVIDDGRGMDPKKLIHKAREKGLIGPDDELTDQQAYRLIFAPGFSTAAVITDISGRGVGMDVVKRNIEQLRGRVDIDSTFGAGSTFSIQLPLTLAIIDGMIVRVGSERFIIQTIMIERAVRPTPEQITTVQKRGAVLNLRGRLIPLVQLGRLFGLSGELNPCDAMVIVANTDSGPIGLVVDELIGQQQVVIKSLGEQFERLRGIAGAAILGDGRVGLILEMTGIANLTRGDTAGPAGLPHVSIEQTLRNSDLTHDPTSASEEEEEFVA